MAASIKDYNYLHSWHRVCSICQRYNTDLFSRLILLTTWCLKRVT